MITRYCLIHFCIFLRSTYWSIMKRSFFFSFVPAPL
jgi:hypothetical protein